MSTVYVDSKESEIGQLVTALTQDNAVNAPHEKALRNIQKVSDITTAEIRRANESEELTDAGKFEAAKKSVARAREALEQHEAHVERLAEKAAATRSKALEVPAGERTTEALMIEREIRDRLHGLDRGEVELRYLNAAGKGDTVFTSAVEGAPEAFRLIDDRTRQHGEEERLKRSPLAERLAAEEAEHAVFSQVVNSTKTVLRELESFSSSARRRAARR